MSNLPLDSIPRFDNELDDLAKKYKNQGFEQSVDKALKNIVSGQEKGDRYPGYGAEYEIRKLRMGFGKVGKSNGARILYGVVDGRYIALSIYLAKAKRKKKLPFTRKEVHQAIQAHRRSKNPD